jgi:hypothetical protein
MPPYVPEFPTSHPNYMYDPSTGEPVPVPAEAPATPSTAMTRISAFPQPFAPGPPWR